MTLASVPETNLRSADRIISLRVKDGEKAKSSTGMLDTRLFTGEQQLRLRMDPQTCLWYFMYSNNGVLPEPLRGRYTQPSQALRVAEQYFEKRNIEIVAIRD